MNYPARRVGPDLRTLLQLFPAAGDLTNAEFVPPAEVPSPYQKLLVHQHHMTVTVERYHRSLVDVRILDRRQDPDTYARKILLVKQSDGRVVQFGLVRIHLCFCSPAVRKEIVAGKTPLGRILIKHNVLRRIEPTGFLRVMPGPNLTQWFGLDEPKETYGRLAFIHCDGRPAIELLEIVAPES